MADKVKAPKKPRRVTNRATTIEQIKIVKAHMRDIIREINAYLGDADSVSPATGASLANNTIEGLKRGIKKIEDITLTDQVAPSVGDSEEPSDDN